MVSCPHWYISPVCSQGLVGDPSERTRAPVRVSRGRMGAASEPLKKPFKSLSREHDEALENLSRTSEEVTQRMPRASPERLRTCIESLPIATLETCQSLSGGFPRASQNLPISSQQARQSFSRASQGPHSEPKPLVTDREGPSRDSQGLLMVPSRALQESIMRPSRASKGLPRRRF